jgi:hypothetical protein
MRDWVHCSLGQLSQCTFRVVRNYFVDGIVPEKGLSISAATTPLTRLLLTVKETLALEI